MSPRKSQSAPPPCIVIFGTESFLVRKATAEAIDQVFPQGVPDMGISEFDVSQVVLADVLDELRTLPFLSERRLVMIRDAEAFISKNRENLEKYLAAPSPTGVLLMICKTFDARTKLYKAVQKVGRAVKCKPLYPKQVAMWIVDRARDGYRKRMDRSAASRLHDLVGGSLSTLDAELDKLSIFVGEKPDIQLGDIEALVGHNRDEKVFGIVDAMASGQTGRALELWHQVWATDRVAEGRAIGGLAYSLRRLLEARTAAEAGVPLEKLARQLWTEPDVLAKRFRNCQVCDIENQLMDLLDVDLRAKTGRTNVRDAVEKFIVTHSTQAPKREKPPRAGLVPSGSGRA